MNSPHNLRKIVNEQNAARLADFNKSWEACFTTDAGYMADKAFVRDVKMPIPISLSYRSEWIDFMNYQRLLSTTS